MLTLSTTDIELEQVANNKQDAIRNIAADLTNKNFVKTGYLQGMIAREKQNSTFLGNGIAIPHGTTDTRHLVKKTGVSVHHFPQGVDWGDNNVVYIAIGIAADSDQHLGILKQLTNVLSADGVEQKLKGKLTKEHIIALLKGEMQLHADFNQSLIAKNFPAKDMLQITAVAGGLIKNTEAADTDFVAQLISKEPTYYGDGLWLTSASQGVSRSAMSYVSTTNQIEFKGSPVKALIAIASCNGSYQYILNVFSQLIFKQKQREIIGASADALISLFNRQPSNTVSLESGIKAIFKINNPHGLHARPGAMLVSEAKKFAADIRVSNLNSDGKQVNAKSLMKVIGLGVTCGHQLEFVAQGEDAQQALDAIGLIIKAGLGEA